MINTHRAARIGVALALVGLGACTQNGGLGSILGGVLGGGNQVSGTVNGIDTRYQQITVTQPNGQQVMIQYDNQTRVVYQNQNYSVSSLQYGDQVTARVQTTQNNGYYTDFVQVDQSVRSGGGIYNNSQVQSIQGIVRNVDRQNGTFEVAPSNGVTLVVSMPYNANSADMQRFTNLRSGDNVRFSGVYINNSRVELRGFY